MSILWLTLAQNTIGVIDYYDICQAEQVKTSMAELKYDQSEQNIQQPT